MVRFLIVFLFFFTIKAHAITVSGAGVGTITIDGQVLSTTGLKILDCQNRSSATYSMPSDMSVAAPASSYQVPVGKTFTVHAIRVFGNGTADTLRFGYADNSNGDGGGATVPTNYKVFGSQGWITGLGLMRLNTTDGVVQSLAIGGVWVVPAQKYFVCEHVNTSALDVALIYGYEQ